MVIDKSITTDEMLKALEHEKMFQSRMKFEDRAKHVRQQVYEEQRILYFTKTDINVLRALMDCQPLANTPRGFLIGFKELVRIDYIKRSLRHLASSVTFLYRIGVIDTMEMEPAVIFTVDRSKIHKVLDYIKKTGSYIRVINGTDAKILSILLQRQNYSMEMTALSMTGLKFTEYSNGCISFNGDNITIADGLLNEVSAYKEMLNFIGEISRI